MEHAEEVAAQDDRAQVESSLELEKLMAGLSHKVRQAIQYVKLDGLSVREAAARCGMSESNERGEHVVERRFGIRQLLGKASIKSD